MAMAVATDPQRHSGCNHVLPLLAGWLAGLDAGHVNNSCPGTGPFKSWRQVGPLHVFNGHCRLAAASRHG
jgi:hypothetical protein